MASAAQILTFEPNTVFHIRQKERSTLKGILWTVGGAVSLNLSVILAVTTPLLALAGVAMSIEKPGEAGACLLLTAGFAGASYFSFPAVTACYRNASYHFGPKYEIVKIN